MLYLSEFMKNAVWNPGADVNVGSVLRDEESPCQIRFQISCGKSQQCCQGNHFQTSEHQKQKPWFYLQKCCVVTKADGTRMIVTPGKPAQTLGDGGRPMVTEKDLRLLKIFSIGAMVLFFPTGALGFYYYRRAKWEFKVGQRRNDLRAARKSSKASERFILISLVCAVLTYSLIFVLVHETSWKHHHHKTLG